MDDPVPPPAGPGGTADKEGDDTIPPAPQPEGVDEAKPKSTPKSDTSSPPSSSGPDDGPKEVLKEPDPNPPSPTTNTLALKITPAPVATDLPASPGRLSMSRKLEAEVKKVSGP